MSSTPDGFHALMYHEVVPENEMPTEGRPIDVYQQYADVLPAPLFIRVEEFRAQMHWLKRHGFTTVTLNDVRQFIHNGWTLPDNPVLLTVDDLFQSVRMHAYPILQELGFHAVGFVVGAWVFPTPEPPTTTVSRTLSWPDLASMADVFEYANHSTSLHTRTGGESAVQSASRDTLLEDLRQGASRLDQPDVYAYPFGSYTNKAIEWLESGGAALAFTTNPGYNNAKTPPMRLHRNGIFRGMSLDAFASIFS
jgi:peptidoglycan/xylan/chitin deacetylase (PgdA/CDA1 family)